MSVVPSRDDVAVDDVTRSPWWAPNVDCPRCGAPVEVRSIFRWVEIEPEEPDDEPTYEPRVEHEFRCGGDCGASGDWRTMARSMQRAHFSRRTRR